MTETWQPLSERISGRAPAPPVKGVPPYLYRPLQEWLYKVLQFTAGPVRVVRPENESELTGDIKLILGITSPSPWLLPQDDPQFIDAIDAALRWTNWGMREALKSWRDDDALALPADLDRVLTLANSEWRVSDKFLGLERRVDATVTDAATEVVRSANVEAADHLRAAWEKAYGRDPDPDTAYREAVRAVEAVACPLVEQKKAAKNLATLGSVIGELRGAGHVWELILPAKDGQPRDVGTIVSMMETLWEGQVSRHAGAPKARRQTQAEAEAAVHLAVLLVQWLSTGVLRRKP